MRDNARWRRLVWQTATPQQQLNIGSADEPFRFCADRHRARGVQQARQTAPATKKQASFSSSAAELCRADHGGGAFNVYTTQRRRALSFSLSMI